MDVPQLVLGHIPSRHRLYAAVAAGTAARLLLFFLVPSLPALLERRPEVMSPLTSFRSLKEGVFIYERGFNPYEGGVLYHSPLYLALFSYIVPVSSNLLTAITWTLADVSAVLALVGTYQARAKKQAEERELGKNVQDDGLKIASNAVKSKVSIDNRPALIALLYLFNPYTLFTCLSRSTSSIDSTFLLLSISFTVSAQPLIGGIFLALASHTAIYPILLLLPLSLTCPSRKLALVLAFTGVAGLVYALNNWLVGSAWIERTWGVVLTVFDLTPNVGMWWYFFTEMFDHFRNFFLGVFQLHTIIYIVPLTYRLRHDPIVAVLVLVGVLATWKSYPTLGDMAAWAGLVSCFPDIVANLRHPLFTLTVHLYTSILLPLLHSLWLLSGTGNANFYYAATMVYGLNASLAVADILGAALTVDTRSRLTKEIFGLDKVEEDEVLREQWNKRRWRVAQMPDL